MSTKEHAVLLADVLFDALISCESRELAKRILCGVILMERAAESDGNGFHDRAYNLRNDASEIHRGRDGYPLSSPADQKKYRMITEGWMAL